MNVLARLAKAEPVGWAEYFAMRRAERCRRRFFNCVGIPLGFIGGTLGLASVVEVDPSLTTLGLEQPLAYSLVALASGLVSAIILPFTFEAVWREAIIRGKIVHFNQMDAEFYRRIRRLRAAPSGFGDSKPFDYYGERILSKSDFRIWLRKQRDIKSAQ